MAKHCGSNRARSRGPKTISVRTHRRSTPGTRCYGPGKPGPKTVRVRAHRRSK